MVTTELSLMTLEVATTDEKDIVTTTSDMSSRDKFVTMMTFGFHSLQHHSDHLLVKSWVLP